MWTALGSFVFFHFKAEKNRQEKTWHGKIKIRFVAKQTKVCDAKLQGL